MRACYGGCGRGIEATFCDRCRTRTPLGLLLEFDEYPDVGQGEHMVDRARVMNQIHAVLVDLREGQEVA